MSAPPDYHDLESRNALSKYRVDTAKFPQNDCWADELSRTDSVAELRCAYSVEMVSRVPFRSLAI